MTDEKRTGSVARVRQAALDLGLDVDLRLMPDTTRTAPEAAAACGCNVAEIVKSLVFTGADSGQPILLLVSGVNRVDETGVAEHIGETLTRADAKRVREVTGFAIGGVAPIGQLTQIPVYLDQDLLQFDRVWAAAGAPNTVFSVSPQALKDAIGAPVIPMS
ncbi:MAG: YbaK/EbsC family protein [Pseudomonadota bacterium]